MQDSEKVKNLEYSTQNEKRDKQLYYLTLNREEFLNEKMAEIKKTKDFSVLETFEEKNEGPTSQEVLKKLSDVTT